MTDEEIYNRLISERTFYGYMYGRNGSVPDEKIIKMTLQKDKYINKSKNNFVYIWGFPGPDYNRYEFKDYGTTWAFDLEDFIDKNAKERFWE